MPESDLEIWLTTPNAKLACAAAHKINAAARAAGTVAGLVDITQALSSEEEKAYSEMIVLMNRLATR